MHSTPTTTPLLNKTALLACSAKTADKLARGLELLGAHVVPLPVLTTRQPSDTSALDAALTKLDTFDWIIFTSSYGVEFFVRRMSECAIPAPHPGKARICAVGPATAAALARSGIEVDLVPQEFVAEGVLRALGERHGGLAQMAGQRILLPRAQEARDILPRELAAAGVLVEIAPCYETVPGELDSETLNSLRSLKPDLLLFTSSAAIANFFSLWGGDAAATALRETTVAVLGPITAATAISAGKHPEIVPQENTVPSLLEAIRRYYQHSTDHL
jgi:uroporphyrinogen III methyltransferase/synthase